MSNNNFLSKKEKQQIKENVNLKDLSNSDVEFIYDLYITKYPAYKSFGAKLISEVINGDMGTNITNRQIEVIRDISIQEEILDNKLILNIQGYNYPTESLEDIYD